MSVIKFGYLYFLVIFQQRAEMIHLYRSIYVGGLHMTKKNDVVKGLKSKVTKNKEGKKQIVVKFDVENKLGYDGCGTHTHK